MVKFWFGGQFPATEENFAFIRRHFDELMSVGPVVAIDNGFTLEMNPDVDEPFRAICREVGVRTVPTTSYRTNLAEQIDLGTEMISYYSSPRTVFSGHLRTLTHALASLNSKKEAGPTLAFSLIRI